MSESTQSAAGGKSAKAKAKPGIFARIVLFIRQVVAELRKVVTPSRNEFSRYVMTVLAFVIVMMLIIAGMDILVGFLVDKVFG